MQTQALGLGAWAERAARLGHNLLRQPSPQPLPGAAPAVTLQRALDVQTLLGRVRYQDRSTIEKRVPSDLKNRTPVINLLFCWGLAPEERHFDSWLKAIAQAQAELEELRTHPEKEVFELLTQEDLSADHVLRLGELLEVQAKAHVAKDLGPTDVKPINVKEDKVSVPVIDVLGKLQIPAKVDFVHPIFRDVVEADEAFVIVVLPEGAGVEVFEKPVEYDGKEYHIDLTAGSSIKPGPGRTGRAFGIEKKTLGKIKDLFGFEESVYYAQRALFPLVSAGVTGRVRGRAYPQEKGMRHVFRLQDGTPVQVDDGWGYVKSSLAHQMTLGGMQFEKRKPSTGTGRASHQMLGWFDDEDLDVIHELVSQGVAHWRKAVEKYQETSKEPLSEGHFESRRVLQSLLTTGKPLMEMAVAMPVTGSDLVVPKGQTRYTRHLPGEVSVIRSPADKQNFHPLPKKRVEQNARISNLVGEIEGIQYTLTGRQDNLLTFFKGMVGVIPDGLWPEDWTNVDLVVSAKDRKLFEKWVRDTSLEEGSKEAEDPETDRAAMSRMRQDFSVTGTLAAVQWFEKGSFVGVPPTVQKWLGGDYDGDEVAMIFGAQNPELQRYVRDKAFQKEGVNPKLTKTFTYQPETSRAGRIVAMRSPNVGVWSNIAARVRSLPTTLRDDLAESTKKGRQLPDDPSLAGLSEVERMEKEIQLGIKVGTDGYKTSVKKEDFEDRAKIYTHLLKSVEPIAHNKKLLDVMEDAGVFPTLKHPVWANIFFRYDEVDGTTGEYVVRGVPARVLQQMIWQLLPSDDRIHVDQYYSEWKQKQGFDPKGTRTRNVNFALNAIDGHTNDFSGFAQQIVNNIVGPVLDFESFVRSFLAARLKLARNAKSTSRADFVSKQQQNPEWVDGLRPLLKRYYRS